MEKNNIAINKKMLCNTKILDVNTDIIVPDIKPDIVNVIDTNGIAYVYKEDITNGSIRLDGNIDTFIIYLSDSGDTRSMQATLNFTESIENKVITEGSFVNEKISLESIEAKVLNERKLSIKASVKIISEVYEKSEAEIMSDFDEIENLEKLKETIDIKSIVGSNKVKTSIKEDISAENGVEIAEILKTNIELKNYENKVSYNKVLAKADAEIKIIYLAENGKIGILSASIPVMSFIDIEKVTDKNICNVEYNIRNMLFKINSQGSNSISTQIEFEVSCEAYEVKTIDVIQDMYGIKNNIEFVKKDIEVQVNNNDVNNMVNISEKILVEDVLNVYDVCGNPRIVNITKSGNLYNYECEMSLTIYYEADSRNGLNVKSVVIPFIVKFENGDDNLDFCITKSNFNVNNENVEINMEVSAKQPSNNLKIISLVDNVVAKELDENEEYKMFMYFVKAGDTIWNIAKKFKVKMDDIIAINNLENPNKINVGDRLYIMR